MNKQQRAEAQHKAEQQRLAAINDAAPKLNRHGEVITQQDTERQAFNAGVMRVVRHHKSRCVLKIKSKPGTVRTRWYPNGLVPADPNGLQPEQVML